MAFSSAIVVAPIAGAPTTAGLSYTFSTLTGDVTMATMCIIEGVHLVPIRNANAFLIEDVNELGLINLGYRRKEVRS